MSYMEFSKYKSREAGYHWEQISKSLKKRNNYVVARFELILNLIENEMKGKKVLDVGCGDGVLSWILAKNGANVIGIDTSKKAMEFANEKCKETKNLSFIIGSAYNLPFEDKIFDYIVSSEVMEHLVEPEKMLLEIRRVWSEEGNIFITTPIKFTKFPLDEMHFQEYYEEDFKNLLKEYFKTVKIIKSHPLFWMEFQNKTIFGHNFFRFFFNLLNLFLSFNPFKKSTGWRYYTLQTAIISK